MQQTGQPSPQENVVWAFAKKAKEIIILADEDFKNQVINLEQYVSQLEELSGSSQTAAHASVVKKELEVKQELPDQTLWRPMESGVVYPPNLLQVKVKAEETANDVEGTNVAGGRTSRVDREDDKQKKLRQAEDRAVQEAEEYIVSLSKTQVKAIGTLK